VVHDFKGDDHNDGVGRSRKRFGEVYATDPPRPSTSSKVTSTWS
jgi:hypothetical protein